MKIDENQILTVAKLAKLELDDDEKKEFSKQLNDIIEYVEKLNELDTQDASSVDYIGDLQNVFRKDAVISSIDLKEIEKVSPRFKDGHIVVPKIIE